MTNLEVEKTAKEVVTAEEGQLGDEFISLMFRESDSEDDEESEEGDDDESDEDMDDGREDEDM